MRFYDPDFGAVYLDGVNIKDYNLHDLRMAISLVM
jgi:ABC-type multidrug transport system fused ATPase/permease subunit